MGRGRAQGSATPPGPQKPPAGPAGRLPTCPAPPKSQSPRGLCPHPGPWILMWPAHPATGEPSCPVDGAAEDRGGDETHTCCVGPVALSLQAGAASGLLALV